MDAYLNAAAEISRLAVGNFEVLPSETTYSKSGYFSQWERIEGAPFGTRGGISALHNFPADGEYLVKMAFDHTTTGEFFGNVTQGEQVEISIDGERVALLNVDQFMAVSDPNGANMQSVPFFVTAGPHQISAVFLKQFEGPVPDLMSRHAWSLADRRIGADGYGITALPHIKDLTIAGPFRVTGVSENPVRRSIFSCRPTAPEEAEECARDIVTRLGSMAFRRSLAGLDVSELMEFYRQGRRRAASRRACVWRCRRSWPARTSSSGLSRSRGANGTEATASASWLSPAGYRTSCGARLPMRSWSRWPRAASSPPT